jgi:hypothetical protein
MSDPRKETAEQPVVSPSVSTDPGRGPWRLRRIPSHVGRARTSTLVLSVLFLAIGALYLQIRPPEQPPPGPTVSDTDIVEPVPTTTAPTSTPTSEPTTTAPETETQDTPTTTAERTPTEEPTETTAPEETREAPETSPPTFSSPSRPAPSPTVVSPPD